MNMLPLVISIHICEGAGLPEEHFAFEIFRLYDGLFANTTTHFIPCKLQANSSIQGRWENHASGH